MKLENYLIGLVIFSIVIIASTAMLGGLHTTYSFPIETQSAGIYSKLNETSTLSQEIGESVRGTKINEASGWEVLASGALSAIKMVLTNFIIVQSLITDISLAIGIPAEIYTAIITIILIMIVFAIINLLWKWEA